MDLNKILSKPFDLGNQVALVTGSSRGIGASIAKLLAAQGAKVIVSSRNLENCMGVVEEIRKKGGEAEAIACHIGEIVSIESLFTQIRDRFGRLDILVNNAAANPYFGPILETSLEAFQKTVDVNIRGYFYTSVEAAKLMKKNAEGKGSGSIVNVASINGVVPGTYQGIYSITKAAIISMTKSFAKECASFNIRVNALLPGATDTKFASALVKNEKILNQLLQHVPMNRVALPEEMAGAVLYFVSPLASYTTGSSLAVDGGYLLG